MTETAPQKKITLNFNGLAEDRVQQMAAATCADPDAEEKFQRRMSGLKACFDELATNQKSCAEMMRVGATYLCEVVKTHDSISEALDEFGRQPAKPSLLARIMGKGNAANSASDKVQGLIDSCTDAVEELDRSLKGVHGAIKEQRNILDGVFADIGPKGNISPEMAFNLRSSMTAAEATEKQFHELMMATDNAKMNGSMLSAKAVQITINQMTAAIP